ncbi:MAG TPA: ATP-dependent DNA helicase RecG, partial [bacterium]|nr:ATP-dependent DNA helicase RecG [bacterium]
MENKLDTPVQYLKGVGPKMAEHLGRMGIRTVKELLWYFPFRYEDRARPVPVSRILPGETVLVVGTVEKTAEEMSPFRRKRIIKIYLKDDGKRLILVAFNQPWLKDLLLPSKRVAVYGKAQLSKEGITMTQFDLELLEEEKDSIHMNRIVPVYRLMKNIRQRWFRKIVWQALREFPEPVSETLPQEVLAKECLLPLGESLRNIHFPDTFPVLLRAQERLKFEEFLKLELALGLVRKKIKREKKRYSYVLKKEFLTPWKRTLPFSFTESQKKAIREIFGDMLSVFPMNRLLQGEVGSGKTVVALSAMLLAAENGYQSCLIAPTEVLAEQHYLNVHNMLKKMGLETGLLKGATRKEDKESLLRKLQEGSLTMVIGTHALLEERVKFKNLSLIIIDEQQRFGVLQRATLHQKGTSPDILVLSATPIPRTLAMTWWGDLDISEIRELPAGRQRVDTLIMEDREAYRFLRREIEKKNQGFIVYPLIDESEKLEYKAASKQAEYLKEKVFPDLRVALLHGRMKTEEKERVMRDFAAGLYDILVSTTVIEVGIDIPKAT